MINHHVQLTGVSDYLFLPWERTAYCMALAICQTLRQARFAYKEGRRKNAKELRGIAAQQHAELDRLVPRDKQGRLYIG